VPNVHLHVNYGAWEAQHHMLVGDQSPFASTVAAINHDASTEEESFTKPGTSQVASLTGSRVLNHNFCIRNSFSFWMVPVTRLLAAAHAYERLGSRYYMYHPCMYIFRGYHNHVPMLTVGRNPHVYRRVFPILGHGKNILPKTGP
jgi:hypothetical protein